MSFYEIFAFLETLMYGMYVHNNTLLISCNPAVFLTTSPAGKMKTNERICNAIRQGLLVSTGHRPPYPPNNYMI